MGKELININPNQIKIEEGFNTRVDYGDINELKNSIIENGVRIPLRGYKENENYILIDGHRRLSAVMMAIQEGADIIKVPFLLESKKTIEERVFEIILSNDGKSLTPLELGETYKRLTLYGYNFSEIAKRIGKTVKHVSDMVGVAESSKDVKDIIKEGGVSATLVAELKSKLKDRDKAEEIIKVVSDIKKESGQGKVTKKDIEDLLPEKPIILEPEPENPLNENTTFTDEEVRELLKRQIKACAEDLPLVYRIKVLRTKLVVDN